MSGLQREDSEVLSQATALLPQSEKDGRRTEPTPGRGRPFHLFLTPMRPSGFLPGVPRPSGTRRSSLPFPPARRPSSVCPHTFPFGTLHAHPVHPSRLPGHFPPPGAMLRVHARYHHALSVRTGRKESETSRRAPSAHRPDRSSRRRCGRRGRKHHERCSAARHAGGQRHAPAAQGRFQPRYRLLSGGRRIRLLRPRSFSGCPARRSGRLVQHAGGKPSFLHPRRGASTGRRRGGWFPFCGRCPGF